MLLRFSTLRFESDSGRKQGILVAAHEVRDNADLSAEQHTELRGCLQWFNDHLYVPSILSEAEHRRAISWFKPGAREAIRRAWELVHILQALDIEIETHKTANPGIVIYEDKWQIVAKPEKNRRVGW